MRNVNHDKPRRVRHVTDRLIMKPEVKDVYAKVANIAHSIRVSKGEAIQLIEAAHAEGREVSADYLYNALYLSVRD